MYATNDSIKLSCSVSWKWEICLYSGRTIRDEFQGLRLGREVWGMKDFEKYKCSASEEINPPFLWELEVKSELDEPLNRCKNLLVFE